MIKYCKCDAAIHIEWIWNGLTYGAHFENAMAEKVQKIDRCPDCGEWLEEAELETAEERSERMICAAWAAL